MIFDNHEYDDFRAEIRRWCKARWPGGVAPKSWPDGPHGKMWSEEYRRSAMGLGEQGWLCGGWPVEYGGGGWRIMKQAVFNEMAAYHRIPGTGLTNSATSIVGPTLMIYGTQEQKDRYLPPIARGETRWQLGFSEPNAGSDLAGLQTRAVANGDEFVINGAKIWNHSVDSDYMQLLARTNVEMPKHKGITQFILPLRDYPGVTIEQIYDLNHEHRWTLVTFDDVRLPRENVIGQVDNGWYQQTTSLDYERAQMGWLGESQRSLEELIAMAKTVKRDGRPVIEDPFIRDHLGELAVAVETSRWINYRVVYLQEQGILPNSEASMSKLFTSEIQQKIMRAGYLIHDTIGTFKAPLADGTDPGDVNHDYWEATGQTIAGGTSEIQRNIIAQRGLGLPR